MVCSGSIADCNLGVGGARMVAAALTESKLTSLKCPAQSTHPRMLLSVFCHRPVNNYTFPALSLCGIGAEGGMAMAAALPSSSLTNLKCASLPLPFADPCFVQRPLTFCTLPAPVPCSCVSVPASGQTTSASRAARRWRTFCPRRKSRSSSARHPPKHPLFSAP